MTSTMLTMYRVDWCLPEKRGKEIKGPRVLRISSRYITLRERRSSWDCLPLDTYEDLARAAREGWYPTPEAALEGSLAYYRAEKEHAGARHIAVLEAMAERAPDTRRCLGCGASAHSAEGEDGRCYHCDATFSKATRRAKGRAK